MRARSLRKCLTLFRPKVSDTSMVLALSVALVGCQARQAHTTPTIRVGQDTCAQCRMIISEARFAASLVSRSGEVTVFDAIECMIRARRAAPDPAPAAWVHDYESDQWREADAAWYVRSPRLPTPMGGGLVAFGDAASARRVAADVTGEMVRWSQVMEE